MAPNKRTAKCLSAAYARNVVMEFMDKNADGQYTTTWAKSAVKKRAQIIDQFTHGGFIPEKMY